MSQVQQVKDATNIIDIIGDRLKLQRAGSSFKANCPFHSEKSPSFNVNEQMQRYKCFGCGESGDVLEFLQKYEGMTFLESLRYLADRAGIELEDFQRTTADDERDRLMAILNLAKEYYHFLLTKHKTGQKARDYLKERGTTNESIKLFQMGYALPGWDGLISYLYKKKKFSLQDIEKTGLIIRNNSGRYYDRFRDRVIFPLKNHRGQVVGFSGRLLNQNPKEAKYINSPETSLYHKSNLLFGYSELFREIKKKREIIVTEGEFDVVSSAQVHVNNIVAIKGSALTMAQVKLFERVADKVLLALDTDSAGVKATRRAIELMKDTPIELRVINLLEASADGKQAKDPDDISRTDPKLWRDMASRSISVYDFLLRITLDKYDATKPEDKSKILKEMAPVLVSISLEVERDFYIQKLAEALNVKPDLIKDDIRKIADKKALSSNPSKKTVDKKESVTKVSKKTQSVRERFEKYILFLLFRSDPDDVFKYFKQIENLNFSIFGAAQILEKLGKFNDTFSLKSFATTLPEDLKQVLFDWYLNPEYATNFEIENLPEEWNTTLVALRKETSKEQINEINRQIEQLDSKNTKTAQEEKILEELLMKIVELQKRS